MFRTVAVFVMLFSGLSINLIGIDKVFIDQIDLGKLNLIHKLGNLQDKKGYRSVYKDTNCLLYYKIWSKDYWLAKNFIGAFKSGFYDGLTSLTALIYDNTGRCRGYVSQAGESVFSSCSNMVIIIEPNSGFPIIAPFVNQKDKAYRRFYTLLCERIIATGYAYIDFSPSNTIILNGDYKLIDLESVMLISSVDQSFFACLSYPSDYKNFISQMKKRFS